MADNNIEERVHEVEKKQVGIETKLDAFIQEMRDRDNQRAEDIRELRQAQAAQQVKHDENIAALRDEMKGIAKEVRNLFLTTAIGIGAMVITVIASIVFR